MPAGVEGGDEGAGFEAVGAEDGELGEGDALDGELLLGVLGAVVGDGVGDQVLERLAVFEVGDGKVAAVRPCLRELAEARALPSGVRGPVDRAALARLAASCFSEMDFIATRM